MSERSSRWTESFTTTSPEETQQLSEKFARQLSKGALVILSGDLGAGKTTFVKGLAKALGIDPNEVISPTFVLIREHHGDKHVLIHADAYRSSTPHEFLEIGLEEYLESDAIVVIEWGEKLHEILPNEAIILQFEMLVGDERRITVSASEPLQL